MDPGDRYRRVSDVGRRGIFNVTDGNNKIDPSQNEFCKGHYRTIEPCRPGYRRGVAPGDSKHRWGDQFEPAHFKSQEGKEFSDPTKEIRKRKNPFHSLLDQD